MMRDGKLFRVIEPNCFSAEARIRDMDATGKLMTVHSKVYIVNNNVMFIIPFNQESLFWPIAKEIYLYQFSTLLHPT